ncbi:hypothetical protein [Brevundimonas sp. DC300-4]|uniref:hypothetical protein n=1 Tax=Brevundimonas sp. DC300-4 TaxID=2804594 RepID=UPI003CEE88B8
MTTQSGEQGGELFFEVISAQLSADETFIVDAGPATLTDETVNMARTANAAPISGAM